MGKRIVLVFYIFSYLHLTYGHKNIFFKFIFNKNQHHLNNVKNYFFRFFRSFSRFFQVYVISIKTSQFLLIVMFFMFFYVFFVRIVSRVLFFNYPMCLRFLAWNQLEIWKRFDYVRYFQTSNLESDSKGQNYAKERLIQKTKQRMVLRGYSKNQPTTPVSLVFVCFFSFCSQIHLLIHTIFYGSIS